MRAYDPGKIGCYAGWRRYEKNPIIGEQIGEVSDPMVLPIKDRFHLYYSHRFLKKILVAVGENGLDFRPFAEDGVTEEKTESKAYVIGDTFYSDGGDFWLFPDKASRAEMGSCCLPAVCFVCKRQVPPVLYREAV